MIYNILPFVFNFYGFLYFFLLFIPARLFFKFYKYYKIKMFPNKKKYCLICKLPSLFFFFIHFLSHIIYFPKFKSNFPKYIYFDFLFFFLQFFVFLFPQMRFFNNEICFFFFIISF